jgi:hypothetical protein
VDFLGVESATTYQGTPYFFLFDEIDSHDSEELRQHLTLFVEKQLAFVWYRTSKGFHIISLSMLDLKAWDLARKELQRLRRNHFPNLVIRIERKPADSWHLYFENQDFSQKWKVSSSLLQMYERKFQVKINIPSEQLVKTPLLFTHYTQVTLV